MTSCQKIGCPHEALGIPEIMVWAKSRPVAERTIENCLTMRLGLRVCLEHCQDAETFITDENWEALCADVKRNGGAFPDRASAKVMLIPFRS